MQDNKCYPAFYFEKGNIRLTYKRNYFSQKFPVDITANLCYNLITKRKEGNSMNSIWFDMDGTIAELYKVEGWLEALRSNDWSVYSKCAPRHN